MNTTGESPVPTSPADAYAVFCGEINEDNVRNLLSNMTTATVRKQNIHLLFQSSGGCVGDGICLYNFFKSFPVGLTVYNVGSVSSIAVIAYLGAKRRIASARSMFMIHRTTTKLTGAPVAVMKGVTKNLTLSDEHCESILRESITLADGEKWSDLDLSDFFFSGEEAVKIGLAHDIGEFSPPPASEVYHFFDLRQPSK